MSESASPDSILPGDSMSQNRPLPALLTSPKPSSSLRQGSSTPMPVVPEGGALTGKIAPAAKPPGQAELDAYIFNAIDVRMMTQTRDRAGTIEIDQATVVAWEPPLMDFESLYGVKPEPTTQDRKEPSGFGGDSGSLEEDLANESNPLKRMKRILEFITHNFILVLLVLTNFFHRFQKRLYWRAKPGGIHRGVPTAPGSFFQKKERKRRKRKI